MNAISFQRSYVKVRVVRIDSWISYPIEASFRAFISATVTRLSIQFA